MTFNEALTLLQKLHNNEDNGFYLDDISNEIGEHILGLKRQSKDEYINITQFYEDGELVEFKDLSFYMLVNGVSVPYPFKCEDFLADDWIGVLME